MCDLPYPINLFLNYFRAALGPETYAQVRRALRAALAQQRAAAAAEDGEVKSFVLEA